MKKLLISMIAVVSAIIMCFALAGCSKDVKGNTYVFEDYTITGYDEADKDYYENRIERIKTGYAGAEIAFNKDGSCSITFKGEEPEMGCYKQDGKKVYLAETKEDLDGEYAEVYELNGKKLIQTFTDEEDGITYTATFKKK